MSRRIEFFFDFGSPTTYLAWTQIPGLVARTDANVVWRPMLLGGVFKATSNASPVTIPAKGKYMVRDMARYAELYGAPMIMNPFFPINTLALMRGAVSYQMDGPFDDYVALMFRAMWEQAKNMADMDVVQEVLRRGGFDPEDFAARIQRPDVKQQLVANTEEAVQRGAFGAPTFFVGEEMFFGQDRLPALEQWLKRH
jgi:2-hydroxychromene-2-carboxylate isomerase